MAPEQHPVERPGAGDQALPADRRDHELDQLVDDRVLDSDLITRCRRVRRGAAPVIPLLVARRFRLAPAADDHVEVEGTQPVDVLGLVDQAQPGVDAQARQVAHEGQHDALERRRDQENLERHRSLGLGVHQLHVLDHPAGLCEQLEGALEVVPRPAGAVGRGRPIRCREDLVGYASPIALQDLQLLALGQARCRQLGVGEEAFGARVLAEKEVAVGPLEVEGEGERPAHAPVLENGPAGVHGEGLHPGRPSMGDLDLLQPAVAHRRHVVLQRPGLGLVLVVIIDVAGLEGLADDGIVTEVLIADALEVGAPAIDRQVLAPPVLDPLDHDVAAGLEVDDAVGAAAERRLQGGLLEVALLGLPVVLRQDRHLADDQRQLPVAGLGERELDPPLAELLRARDAAVVESVEGMSLGLERLERPDHVVHGDRLAVVPARLGSQVEDHPGTILRPFDGLGDEAVFGERFVAAMGQQRLHGPAGARVALGNVRVEAVEGAALGQSDRAALGRLRVDVVEVGEIGPVFGLAVHGDGVSDVHVIGFAGPLVGPGREGEAKAQSEQDRGEGAHGLRQWAKAAHTMERFASPRPFSSVAGQGVVIALYPAFRRSSAAAWQCGSPAAITRPSDSRPSGRPRQSVMTPPASVTTRTSGRKS